MAIRDLPKKWRDGAHGDAGLLSCPDELEAQLKDVAFCHIYAGAEIHLGLILSDAVFKATMTKTTLLVEWTWNLRGHEISANECKALRCRSGLP
jgi:hypothetical protein